MKTLYLMVKNPSAPNGYFGWATGQNCASITEIPITETAPHHFEVVNDKGEIIKEFLPVHCVLGEEESKK